MIKIALCDDEQVWADRTRALLTQYEESNPSPALRLYTFSSGQELLDYMAMNGPFDIYLLDVVMPYMSGIDVGMGIRKHDEHGKIIYLTFSADYGVDSYLVKAYHYLLKPVDKDLFFDILGRATSDILQHRGKCIQVKTREELTVTVIQLDDIMYVDLDKKSLCYHLSDGSCVTSVSQRESFSSCVAPLLADERFVLSGSATCLNLYYIKQVDKDSILLKKGEKVLLSKKACLSLRTAWLDYWFKET